MWKPILNRRGGIKMAIDMDKALVDGQLQILAQTIESWINFADEDVRSKLKSLKGKEVEFDIWGIGKITAIVGEDGKVKAHVGPSRKPVVTIGARYETVIEISVIPRTTKNLLKVVKNYLLKKKVKVKGSLFAGVKVLKCFMGRPQ
jgi:hypothetical protein